MNLDLDAHTERVQRRSQARLRAEKKNKHALSAAKKNVEKGLVKEVKSENVGAKERCG